MTEEQFLCWLAGFLDGEGAFSVLRRKQRRTVPFQYEPRIGAKNTSKAVLQFVKRQAGMGSIVPEKIAPGNRKPIFQWYVSGEEAVTLARRLIPYLQLKSQQAQLLSQFPVRQGKSLSAKMLRERLYWELKPLNRRGKVDGGSLCIAKEVCGITRTSSSYEEDDLFKRRDP